MFTWFVCFQLNGLNNKSSGIFCLYLHPWFRDGIPKHPNFQNLHAVVLWRENFDHVQKNKDST